jgi:chromosome partitioning protein
MLTAIARVRQENPKQKFLGMVSGKVDAGNSRHRRRLRKLEDAYTQLVLPERAGLRRRIADALVSGVPVPMIRKTAARKAAKETRSSADYVYNSMEVA